MTWNEKGKPQNNIIAMPARKADAAALLKQIAVAMRLSDELGFSLVSAKLSEAHDITLLKLD